MGDFEGQVVLVTGSTRGIGRATAKLFVDNGAHVIISGTSKDCPESVTNEFGDKISYIQGEFSSYEGIHEFAKKISLLPQVDVCVNNAGINRICELENISSQDYQDVMMVNVNAPFEISKVLATKMKSQRYGRIVNIASIWSVITKPGRTAYTLTKNAIVGLTKSLSVELAPFGITVNTVSPGFTLTELTKKSLSEKEMEQLSKQVPANRFAAPEEIGKVILFLSSKDNSYMTGQNIIVDGGFTNV